MNEMVNEIREDNVMNITYATQINKNGKTLYYRITDGKKKQISRAEYEANQVIIENAESNVQLIFGEDTHAENSDFSCENVSEENITAVTSCDEEFSPAEEMNIESETDHNVSMFDIVNSIVKDSNAEQKEKVCIHDRNGEVMINYRKCLVCAISLGDVGITGAIRFLGTSIKSRKKNSVFAFNGSSDLSSFKSEIIEQIKFIDGWYSTLNFKCQSLPQ